MNNNARPNQSLGGANFGNSNQQNNSMGMANNNNMNQNANRQSFPPNNNNTMTSNFNKNGNRNGPENVAPNGQKPVQNQNQQPQFKKSGSITMLNNTNFANISEDEFLSFKQLAPYTPFTIKARVTLKSDKRTFQKQNGGGESTLFSCELLDKEGNEIGATFFGEAVDAFFNVIQENKVYIMMNGNVKMANPKFNR